MYYNGFKIVGGFEMLKYTFIWDGSMQVDDPIYGKFCLPKPYSQIVLTKEMLRLEEYTQTGFAIYEYPGLKEEDRLSHSVGAYYDMYRIIERIQEILKLYNININQDDIDIACCSMLLHDLGHGPYSHSVEKALKYPHEKRTADIILAHLIDPYGPNDTEISQLLVQLYGEKKVKKIASFIADIEDEEILGKNSFTKLLKNLVSHQLDADRLDYLIRDSYYAKMPVPFHLETIINNINVSVNSNQEYELYVQSQGLSSVENVFIKRFQMYRDVYRSAVSVLRDVIFDNVVRLYRKKDLHLLPENNSFQRIVDNEEKLSTHDFLELRQIEIDEALEYIKCLKVDPLLTYLCDLSDVKDYELLQNNKSIEEIKQRMQEVFSNIDLKETLSILQIPVRIVLYKKEQRLNVQVGNRIADITECTNLIRPQEVLEVTYTFVNPKILQIELGLSDEEFKEKESDWNNMVADLNKKPEEFELKYIVNSNESNEELINQFILLFQENGYQVVNRSKKQNSDEYYDKDNFELFQRHASLRIRTATQENKTKYKGTYKKPSGESAVYSSRNEFEQPLKDNQFATFVSKMKTEEGIDLDFSSIKPSPYLNSTTNRKDIVFSKNGYQVCVSLDNSVYTNHDLFETMAHDRMIEIEAMGDLKNRIMLNEIHEFITNGMQGLSINHQSKYERGLIITTHEYLKGFDKSDEYERAMNENVLVRVVNKAKSE